MKSSASGVTRWAGLISVVLAWEVSSYFIDSSILPSPLKVLNAAEHMIVSGVLLEQTMISLQRVLVGFFLGTFLGVVCGALVGLSRLARRTIYILIELLRPVPGIAWLPLAVLWFGLGEGSKYFLIAIGVFFPVFVGTLRGMQQTDPMHVRSGQALGASQFQIVRDIIWPTALPEILTGQRVGLSLGFIYMVAAELIGGQSGLGYMITYARMVGLPEQIYVGILTIGALNLGLGAVQKMIERHSLRWHFGLEQGGVR